jgi:hypothetical protein
MNGRSHILTLAAAMCDTSTSINQQNKLAARKDSTSRLIGASWSERAWRAMIRADGKRVHLGRYETAEQAHAAYMAAKAALHREALGTEVSPTGLQAARMLAFESSPGHQNHKGQHASAGPF